MTIPTNGEAVVVVERSNVNIADFAALLEESRKTLASAYGDAAVSPELPDVRAEGTAADGRVRVAVSAGGHVESVTIEPKAMRLGAEELGEELAKAMNAALADLRTKSFEAAGVPEAMPNGKELSDQLIGVQEDAVRRMTTFVDSLDDALQKIGRAAGTHE